MGDIVRFNGFTTHDIPVERVLESAKGLDKVLVLGVDDDGEFYAAASSADMLWAYHLAGKFQHKILDGDFSGAIGN